jgi:hypothetical protein
MAAEGEAPEKMLRVHRGGYTGFVQLMKWGALFSFVAAIVVILLIAS